MIQLLANKHNKTVAFLLTFLFYLDFLSAAASNMHCFYGYCSQYNNYYFNGKKNFVDFSFERGISSLNIDNSSEYLSGNKNEETSESEKQAKYFIDPTSPKCRHFNR